MSIRINFIIFLKFFVAGMIGIRNVLLMIFFTLIISSIVLFLVESVEPSQESEAENSVRQIRLILDDTHSNDRKIDSRIREVSIKLDRLEKQIASTREGHYIEGRSPDTFFRSVYLTSISFTTIGFGDVVPRTVIGRLLSIFNGLLGMISIGILTSVGFQALRLSIGE